MDGMFKNRKNKGLRDSNDYLLSLEICMHECESKNNYDLLEKIVSSVSNIVGKHKTKKGCSWLLEEGDAHIYFLNNTVFEITNYKKNPIIVLNQIVNLYAPKRGNGTYFSNEAFGLKNPLSYIKNDENYFYQISTPVQDSMEIRFSRKNKV